MQILCSFFMLLLALQPVLSFTHTRSTIKSISQQPPSDSERRNCIIRAEKATNADNEYSREVRMREEAESPFRKVRFLLYFALGGGAATSLAVSAARVAAALSGINTDLLQESAVNVAVDILGIGVLAFLYKRDLDAQESRLKRASKGAELAKLMVRGSNSMLDGSDAYSNAASESFTTSLASFRRGRGIEKRIVIAAGGRSKIDDVLKEARALEDSLRLNDLVVIPILFPEGRAPDQDENIPSCVALPTSEAKWRSFLEEEAKEAIAQGVDVEQEGFCVVLKKNGRVGQRTRGIFLDKMVGEVTKRREMGLDVKNI